MKKTQGISNTLNLRQRRKLERGGTHSMTGDTVQTYSFTAYLDPFPFSSHLSFPTFPLPWLPSSSSLCTFHILQRPTAEKIFLMHGMVFTEQISVFSWRGSSVFQHPSFGDVPQPLLSRETSYLKLFPKLFSLFPGDSPLWPF